MSAHSTEAKRNRQLQVLSQLTPAKREQLRRAVIRGMSNYAAATEVGCSADLAGVMRARLTTLGVVPPLPTQTLKKPKRPKDERQAELPW
jgi:FixJ family two-component response regulator